MVAFCAYPRYTETLTRTSDVNFYPYQKKETVELFIYNDTNCNYTSQLHFRLSESSVGAGARKWFSRLRIRLRLHPPSKLPSSLASQIKLAKLLIQKEVKKCLWYVNFYHKNTFTTVLITQVNFISDYQKAHTSWSSEVCGSRTWETESIHPITKRQQLRGRKNKGLC